MKKGHCYLFLLVLFSPAVSQQQRVPNGTISGVVVKANGAPARNLRLTASPSFPTGGHSGDFPHARTNNLGEYQFQKLSLWGTYLIYADDETAGYSRVSTGPLDSHTDVEITPDHPEAQFNFSLPPKAGFIRIHLTNRRTGAVIREMTVSVLPLEKQDFSFTISSGSDHLILVPPDRNLLIHVTSDGFPEWDESIGAGRPVNVSPGGRLVLDVQLEPSD
jgi:hypothetical protein